MLTKMGYTPGTGLGAPHRQGASEPIQLTMRPARSGLGVAEEQRATQAAAEAQRAMRGGQLQQPGICVFAVLTHTSTEEQRVQHEQQAREAFVASRADHFERRRAASHLAQAQKACACICCIVLAFIRHRRVSHWTKRRVLRSTTVGPLRTPLMKASSCTRCCPTCATAIATASFVASRFGGLHMRQWMIHPVTVQYGDAQDMQQHCPGEAWAAHEDP